VLETYPEKVKMVFKNFPLKMHKFATPAALAALSAERQGKFWEFHDRLFDNYKQLSDQKIKDIASELQLNQEKFEKDMKSPSIQAKVRRDYQEGTRVNVRGTPTVFINGRRLKNRTLEGFRDVIEKELERLNKKK